MIEVARVSLDNEMDLVLAHKRSMKLAELSGLSLAAQTTFATAVSEVARTTIENGRHGKNGCLVLAISKEQKNDRYIIASIKEESTGIRRSPGIVYAERLVDKFNIRETSSSTFIELYYHIPGGSKLEPSTISSWKSYFTEERSITPYEEIKRKNDLLKELAEKLQESESQYKTLTNTLPMLIFTLDKEGKLKYFNEWFRHYAGNAAMEDGTVLWKSLIHERDAEAFSLLLNKKISVAGSTLKTQCRLKNAETGEYLWHLISVSPQRDDKNNIGEWAGYAVDIHAQKVYEAALQDNEELKEIQHELEEHRNRLEANIQELNRSNEELQQFAFVASHDLQEPVRKVAYYADLLQNRYADKLDPKAKSYLDSMFMASYRMRNLINDVLSYSQVNTKTANFETIDLNLIMRQVIGDHELSIKEKQATVHVPNLPFIRADHSMISQLFSNLLGNALKYSRKGVAPEINIASVVNGNCVQVSVQDNGVGFENKHADSMFRLFQRLHSKDEYAGTGVGLALCRKIVDVHHGTITAMGQPGKGSSFIITLPLNN